MKTKIICILILFIIFSCKNDETKSFKEELTQSIQRKIKQELKQDGSSLESIQLVKLDTLKEWQEADLLLQYSTQRLIILNKQQQQLSKELDNVKTVKDFEQVELKYAKVKDSINHEIKITESVSHLEPKKDKTGNYQAIFLLKVFEKKSNTVKNDSLFMYVNDKKVIFTQPQFIEQCIKKFNKN
ncbi:hypothetical protein IQ37_17175 [Chryseobacterium piperi]|uniref:Lipoprotein n=1 Tax=Chryseobacterium piperi TaxID=558152 RepID=A0A086AKK4_9FLAO|nr:hypothetical protein [Chryseobacterium piperi]ASW75959.1 hypothetical protein CJF12_17915 [Chryseobacterium piperi]KFF17218.1 hypothetical protein IQ37_17175 [Chryseobacterium piperi]